MLGHFVCALCVLKLSLLTFLCWLLIFFLMNLLVLDFVIWCLVILDGNLELCA